MGVEEEPLSDIDTKEIEELKLKRNSNKYNTSLSRRRSPIQSDRWDGTKNPSVT
jgi:hypothetical protein